MTNSDDFRTKSVVEPPSSTGTLALQDLLTRVAEDAVSAIPGADAAGVTLMVTGQPDMHAASGAFAADVDTMQYGLGEGPCISAADEGRTVRSGSLAETTTWPNFTAQVAGLGLNSVLSLPMILDDVTIIGAINVYAHLPNAFSQRAQELGERFAGPAAIAAHNVRVLCQTRRLSEQLQAALASLAVIDQAIGILLSSGERSASEASAMLSHMSESEQVPMAEAAGRVVANAVRTTHPPSPS
jgi:GAF domain-containing protein